MPVVRKINLNVFNATVLMLIFTMQDQMVYAHMFDNKECVSGQQCERHEQAAIMAEPATLYSVSKNCSRLNCSLYMRVIR